MHKRTPAQRELDLIEIEGLYYGKCWTMIQIADHLNEKRPYQLSVTTIRNDIKKILKAAQEEFLDRTAVSFITQELMKLTQIEAEAWKAWEESKSRKVKVRTKSEPSQGAGDEITSRIVTQDRGPGDHKFLDLIARVSKQRTELIGVMGVLTQQRRSELNAIDSPADEEDVEVFDLGNGNILKW